MGDEFYRENDVPKMITDNFSRMVRRAKKRLNYVNLRINNQRGNINSNNTSNRYQNDKENKGTVAKDSKYKQQSKVNLECGERENNERKNSPDRYNDNHRYIRTEDYNLNYNHQIRGDFIETNIVDNKKRDLPSSYNGVKTSKIDQQTYDNQVTLIFQEAKLFADYARNFQGLYEDCYQITKRRYTVDRTIQILREYKGRLSYIPELKYINKFFSYIDGLKEDKANMDEIIIFTEWWISYLKLCGIKRSEKKGMIEIVNGDSLYYIEENGEDLLVGDKCMILTPYWSIKEYVLEKGRVSKIIES